MQAPILVRRGAGKAVVAVLVSGNGPRDLPGERLDPPGVRRKHGDPAPTLHPGIDLDVMPLAIKQLSHGTIGIDH